MQKRQRSLGFPHTQTRRRSSSLRPSSHVSIAAPEFDSGASQGGPTCLELPVWRLGGCFRAVARPRVVARGRRLRGGGSAQALPLPPQVSGLRNSWAYAGGRSARLNPFAARPLQIARARYFSDRLMTLRIYWGRGPLFWKSTTETGYGTPDSHSKNVEIRVFDMNILLINKCCCWTKGSLRNHRPIIVDCADY